MKHKFSLAVALLILILWAGCSLEGPWSFYPEERDVYMGVYTYGYVEAGSAPKICFKKVYKLTESSAEDFAFYDSAKVSVFGKFENTDETQIELFPSKTSPNCFESKIEAQGISGESYKMEAFIKWDSAGKSVLSNYKASATIPSKFKVTGIRAPQKDGSYKWKENKGETISLQFLEYPIDMSLIKFVTDYDSTVGGLIITKEYDIFNGGENMHTTINNMLEGMTGSDSMGFTNISMHDALEYTTFDSFNSNVTIGGYHSLDTILQTNFSFPIGTSILHFYATDKAYAIYNDYALASFEDPRVVAKSNIENGMGVFTGLLRTDVKINMKSDSYIPYTYISVASCNNPGMEDETWNSRSCRLFQEIYCSRTELGNWENVDEYDLRILNEKAYLHFPQNDTLAHEEFCYAPAVKAAMMLDSSNWNAFLQDSLSQSTLLEAYGEGLMRYCVASDFKSNSIASCDKLEKECQTSEKNNFCKEYLWQWCSDRNWNFEKYPQCGTGLVSRFRLENVESSILEKVVQQWCHENPKDPQCIFLKK
ncbi:MAG: hypothetical protein HUK21_06325 [Fibrobacteraceae bacterium]|nr:hypothetical protein [Fibrobacteraceae bacterium]